MKSGSSQPPDELSAQVGYRDTLNVFPGGHDTGSLSGLPSRSHTKYVAPSIRMLLSARSSLEFALPRSLRYHSKLWATVHRFARLHQFRADIDIGDFEGVTGQPILRIARADLDNLMTTLEVSFVKLAECLVSPGWRLVLSHTDAPGIHYSLSGTGRMIIGDHPPIDLVPHTLIIAPRGLPVQFEALAAGG